MFQNNYYGIKYNSLFNLLESFSQVNKFIYIILICFYVTFNKNSTLNPKTELNLEFSIQLTTPSLDKLLSGHPQNLFYPNVF